MFASKTLTRHILRGLAGFALVGVAIFFAEELGWWTAAALLAALVLFRGCPSCWLMGLFETLTNRKAGCLDGTCAPGSRVPGS